MNRNSMNSMNSTNNGWRTGVIFFVPLPSRVSHFALASRLLPLAWKNAKKYGLFCRLFFLLRNFDTQHCGLALICITLACKPFLALGTRHGLTTQPVCKRIKSFHFTSRYVDQEWIRNYFVMLIRKCKKTLMNKLYFSFKVAILDWTGS